MSKFLLIFDQRKSNVKKKKRKEKMIRLESRPPSSKRQLVIPEKSINSILFNNADIAPPVNGTVSVTEPFFISPLFAEKSQRYQNDNGGKFYK